MSKRLAIASSDLAPKTTGGRNGRSWRERRAPVNRRIDVSGGPHVRKTSTAPLRACAAIMALLASAGAASAQVVDGFNVAFNPLPSTDITTQLTPSSLTPSINYFFFDGVGTLAASGHDWGQTSPFTYSPTLNGSAFVGLYNGSATYDYATPQTTFSILWGSVDNDNSLSLFSGATLLGTIQGSDLRQVINATPLNSSQLFNGGEPYVDVTIDLPGGFTSAVVTGAPDLTFEYSNIVTTDTLATIAPEPGSCALALLGIGVAIGGRVGAGRRRELRAAR